MRAIYAPGSSDTTSADPNVQYRPKVPLSEGGSGAGGQFAAFVKGATPKYAINNGPREESYRNTMARLFMRVNAGEFRSLFLPSIPSEVTRRLAQQLAGDPAHPSSRGEGGGGTGYMDFLLQHVQHSFREKVQIMETLSDNYVPYYFGQSAPLWSYSGAFINSVQDDQASSFVRLYLDVIRGTQLARRQKTVVLRYDSFVVSGTIESIDWSLNAENELLCPFQMAFRVKALRFNNTTSGWVPNNPNTPVADPDAIAFDRGSRPAGSVLTLIGSVPTDTVPGPTSESQEPADPNPVASTTGAPTNASMPVNPNRSVRPNRPETATEIAVNFERLNAR